MDDKTTDTLPSQTPSAAEGVKNEERRSKERKLARSSVEGRERYLDMVQKERMMLIEQGVSRSTDQLLLSAGVGSSEDLEEENALKDSATGDQIRSILPVQVWLPLNVHIIGLSDGVLSLAPLYELNDRQIENLTSTIQRGGFLVKSVDIEMWDRAELLQTLRTVHDLSADRCEKTLVEWLEDEDNGLLLNQFMRDMMAEALQMRVSDVHLVQDNASEAPNWIKYRVDGDILPMHLLPAEAMARLTTLIKRDAGLNFGDRTTPKDGRFSFNWQGRTIDVRVAAGPHAQDGEKITMRLLDRASLKNFNELFRRHQHMAEYLGKLLSPDIKGGGGLILLSGPTGSGKTTTLYACVQQIDRRRRHVLTIEDPIEYEMRYATQWQVRHSMDGGSFADLIRAAMRHDPDYIVIGEMRDGETVETALKAAESGHTVISTIHADTAFQTFERLRSMMPPERERASTYTLSQQVRAILNQRLVKTLCQGCAHHVTAEDILTESQLKVLDIPSRTPVRHQNLSGCNLCGRTGILGRTLLLDALVIKLGVNKRTPLYNVLLQNVNDIVHLDGVEYFSRREGLLDLVKIGLMDPRMAIGYLEE